MGGPTGAEEEAIARYGEEAETEQVVVMEMEMEPDWGII